MVIALGLALLRVCLAEGEQRRGGSEGIEAPCGRGEPVGGSPSSLFRGEDACAPDAGEFGTDGKPDIHNYPRRGLLCH